MTDPRFGAGPPAADGGPATDGWADDCEQQAQTLTGHLKQQLGRMFGNTEQHQDQPPGWFNP
ncbi:hypothetical protein VST63_25475 [Mycolicibacterium sp. 050232]|uniref:hypothetical protein n=1 Tax=Mycolicibacterium sp. 050232 TaxID=3113982 RepID=UPI002E27FB0E|nr:hypothetical protein [Mycolicibacterium sp. 050232]MED5815724.1 hypothetical protein [Mycolicibacterium sp. 050232]